ncbi:MAG: GNAT family N-acetyltransferase [bacterium]|nr:GNAT family N-acetyltransferase [bacterium]
MSHNAVHMSALAPEHFTQAAGSLARAFDTDPLYRYILPEDSTRVARLQWYFEALLRLGAQLGEIYTVPGQVGAVILLPPERASVPISEAMRAGFWRAPLHWGIDGSARFMRCIGSFETLHHQVVGEVPHWYLMLLGVDPSAQGQGYGGDLIDTVIDRVEYAGRGIYLETCTAANVALYEHFNFAVRAETVVEPGSLRVWGMAREVGLPMRA